MATSSGTASDYLDLLAKFNTFVTGLGGGAAWTAVRNLSTEKIWHAPGGGSDDIYVGMKAFFNAGADYYNFRLGGFLAFDSGLAFENQSGYVGVYQNTPRPSPVLTLWNSPIDYRFYATGRRAIIVAKVSTVYVCAYLGLLAAYASPGAWPYPLVVGGNLAFETEPGAADAAWRWSNATADNSNHVIPVKVPTDPWESALRLRDRNGTWLGFGLNVTENRPGFGRVWPWANWGSNTGAGGNTPDWRDNLDGSYSLLPVILNDSTPNCYGELDGILAVTGFNNGAENIVNDGADDHFVVQNVFRTDQMAYFAVKET
jgi:hypothetical protein